LKIEKKVQSLTSFLKKYKKRDLTGIDEVLLDELDLVKGCLLPGGEKGSLGDDLVDRTDLAGQVVLNEVGHKVAANEANSSKNQHAGLAHD